MSDLSEKNSDKCQPSDLSEKTSIFQNQSYCSVAATIETYSRTTQTIETTIYIIYIVKIIASPPQAEIFGDFDVANTIWDQI